jgi:hypothetical protein
MRLRLNGLGGRRSLVAIGCWLLALVGIWTPQPLRGVLELGIGLGAPVWALGLFLEAVGVDLILRTGLAIVSALAAWSLGGLLLLALGIHLVLPAVLPMLFVFVAFPLLLTAHRESRAMDEGLISPDGESLGGSAN